MAFRKLEYIEVVRTLAIFLIAAFHAAQYGVVNLKLDYSVPYLSVSALIRFTVPAFFIIAGFLLGRKNDFVDPVGFIKGKLLRIGLPLVLWGVIYGVASDPFNWENIISLNGIIRILTGAGPPYHLWFLFVMVQLMILYALLQRISFKTLFNASLILQVIFFLIGDVVLAVIGNDHHFYEWTLGLFFPAWAGFFALGLILGRYPVIMDRLGRWKTPLALIGALTLVGVIIEYHREIISFGEPVRFFILGIGLINQYSMAVLVILTLRNIESFAMSEGAANFWRRMAGLGKYTYGVYLSHLLFVMLLFETMEKLTPDWSPVVKVGLLVVCVYPFSLLFVNLFRLPVLRRIGPYILG